MLVFLRILPPAPINTRMTTYSSDAARPLGPLRRPHGGFPVRLVQCQLETDHFAGLDRALAERSIASERVFPDQPPPPMGEQTRAVVVTDPFASMNALAARQARRVGASVVLLMDGVVEYRNTFVNPRVTGVLARGDNHSTAFLRPAPADFVACCGDIDRRILTALGNHAVATGLPRLASMSRVPDPPSRRAVLIATANQPWFTDAERHRVITSLRALKETLDRCGVEGVWRLRGDLDAELGVASDRRPLRDVLAEVPAVITTPSTLLVESMLAQRPTAILHAHPTPLWQPAAWGWRAPGAGDEPDVSAASDLSPDQRRALLSIHEEASSMTAWYDDLAAMIESLLARDAAMMSRQAACLKLLYAGPEGSGKRAPAENLAGMLECICAGDIRPTGKAPSFPSPVRIPSRRASTNRPCVVSCVVSDDTPVGGVLTWSQRLSDAFAQRDLGYDVRTLIICVKPDAWRASGVSIQPTERTDLCVIDPMADHVETIAHVRRSIEHLAGGVPAVVIPNYADIAYAAAMQLRARGTRTLAVAHTDEEYYKELASTYSLWDGAVGVSRACMDWLRPIEVTTRAYRTPPRPMDCIPCMAPVASAPRAVAPDGPIKLAYVGRMVQVQKRIADLLLVVDGLEARAVPFVLHMIGDGVDLPAWRADLGKRSLRHGRVVIHGRRDHEWVESFIRTIDVSVLVSEFEGTSVSMLEAMGAGVVPAVTAVRSGVDEWVRDNENGIVVPVGAPDQMAERLAGLARNRAEIARLGRSAWEKVRREASIERMAERYRAIFDQIRARAASEAPTDLGVRLIERWRWNKDWAENPAMTLARVRDLLAEAGYRNIVNDAPIPGCDAVIVRADERPLSRVQAEQIALWRECGLGVVIAPHLRSGGPEDAMAPAEARACDRVRSIAARAAAQGCSRIAVYGTGKHTRRLAPIFDGSLPFVGFIDDAPPAWEYMFGLPIVSFEKALDALRPDAVILSSDAWEARMWERTLPLRRAGVRVIPIYAEYTDAEPVIATTASRAAAA